ncbi:delta(14)-sterol reductase TM7SF2-like [Oscarella lobularis]|uniref:delta(14)-sterol reductase TM7SF2-like n=1 Tax=Oscarella lobularis TaxID=121494 RepID=UPI0033130C1C
MLAQEVTKRKGSRGPRKDDRMATPLEAMTATLAPKTTEYKFGGPIGATISYFVLPLIAYFVYFACRRDACDLTKIASSFRLPRDVNEWISVESLGVVVGFMLLQALLYCIPAGKAVSGSILRDGSRLKYRMNGLLSLIVSVGVFGALWYYRQPVTFVYDHFLEMITAVSIVAFVLSVVAHSMSLQRGVMLSEYGNSGNFLYDFFMGRALNPRIASVLDMKMLIFGRFMLIGYILAGLSMLAKQYETDGKVSLPMVLVCAMQFLYVFDGLYFEEDILSINEFSKQGVGFLICYAIMVFRPILYSLPARFLVDNPVELPQMQIATILILEVVGYVIYRWSNTQKNSYRRNPDSESSKRLKVLKTARGTNLVISGLWGFVRHPNYLGDLMMHLAWCLCTGVGHFMPYLTFVFLLLMLIGRANQDDADCRKKYKLDWDTYCNIVRYKIVPYIF